MHQEKFDAQDESDAFDNSAAARAWNIAKDFTGVKPITNTHIVDAGPEQQIPSGIGTIAIIWNDDGQKEHAITSRNVLYVSSSPASLGRITKLAHNWTDDKDTGMPDDGNWERTHHNYSAFS